VDGEDKGRNYAMENYNGGFRCGQRSLKNKIAELKSDYAELERIKSKLFNVNKQRMNENAELKAKNKKLKGAIDFIYNECDWEEGHGEDSYGDNRIGDCCRNLLKEMKDE